ncbi:uncharacterized protein P884DRAFT_14958 [Thermothelomyces heterothallicus CBS 202.75]|uniref:uncharacterized protein n=1 Tax=Thermothelomyces heterothallicus CBS 202.75 TaxID=1149848 RepID=UPI0037438913
MAPRHQHTFTLVPNPLGMQGLMSRPTNGPQSKPPMTSKQAQKLYREATRGPRLSKAEQRRIEREEQERIRRELEREKQLNRARVLRERKKAKEQQALEERRRKGLPLVDVRPSQDTIARFVRGNGAGKKRDAAGESVDIPAVQAEATGAGSVVGYRSNEEEPFREATDTRESKMRRLGQDPRGEEGEDRGPQRAPDAKGVEGPSAVTAIERAEKSSFTTESKVSVPGYPVINSAEAVKVPPPVAKACTGEGESRSTSVQAELRTESQLEQQRAGNPTSAATSSENASPTVVCRPISAGNAVLTKPSEVVVDEGLDKGVMTKRPVVPSVRQHTPSRDLLNITMHERAMATTPKPQPKQLAMSPMPEKPPINKRPQTPNPLARASPSQRQQQQQQQQRPSSRPPQAQPVPTRKALHETTNSSNRMRPVSVTDGASKFASPYKHTIATPQRQSPNNGPAFRQTKPSNSSAGTVQKPQFLPAHLRNAATHNQPVSQTSAAKAQSRSPQGNFLSEPPTSTQLFIMSHLDELLPSPTQEVREIQGDSPPAVSKPTRPDTERPPIAAFVTDRSRRLARQVTHVQEPMAPPPRPTTVVQQTQTKAVAGKPAPVPEPSDAFELSFLSTQDLSFSSQDLRELDEPTSSAGTVNPRSNNGPPPFKQRTTAPQRPSLLSHSPSGVTAQQSTPQHRPKPPDSTARRHTSPICATRQLPGSAVGNGCCSTPTCVVERKPALECNKYVPPSDKNRQPPEGQPRGPSPEKPRFFGSSGEGIVALALDRSIKTYQEEEERRRREREAQQDVAKAGSVGIGRGLDRQKASPPPNMENQMRKDATRREYEHATLPRQKPPTTSNNSAPSNVHKEDAASQPTIMHTASQETEYGDVELDSMDLELLFETTG